MQPSLPLPLCMPPAAHLHLRCAGVELASGEQLRADAVIVALGRYSRLPQVRCLPPAAGSCLLLLAAD